VGSSVQGLTADALPYSHPHPVAAKDSIKVLIAEDEPAMLSLVARHLREMGFSVVEAAEGDAAWELAQEHQPDLVVLDVMMPGMSGWEVCKRIKSPASEGFGATGVIMLTGIGENLNDMTSPLFAADTWLNKPFDFADLEAKIHETLDKYHKALPDGASGGSVSESTRRPSPKRPAAKKAPKAPGLKKAPVKKPVAKKAVAKKPVAKKAVAKKGVKKPAAKKPVAKKPVAKKAAKKSPTPKKRARAK
jgi:DNA-binding response OmpR family regulator